MTKSKSNSGWHTSAAPTGFVGRRQEPCSSSPRSSYSPLPLPPSCPMCRRSRRPRRTTTCTANFYWSGSAGEICSTSDPAALQQETAPERFPPCVMYGYCKHPPIHHASNRCPYFLVRCSRLMSSVQNFVCLFNRVIERLFETQVHTPASADDFLRPIEILGATL